MESKIGWREGDETLLGESLRGNTIRGQQDREPLRGKPASERVSEREVFRVFQRFLVVFSDFKRF